MYLIKIVIKITDGSFCIKLYIMDYVIIYYLKKFTYFIIMALKYVQIRRILDNKISIF